MIKDANATTSENAAAASGAANLDTESKKLASQEVPSMVQVIEGKDGELDLIVSNS